MLEQAIDPGTSRTRRRGCHGWYLHAWAFALVSYGLPSMGDGTWGGSLDVTNDYLVRGISRSNDQAALQLDGHYVNSNGLLAGIFASNAQIDPGARRDAEISGFLGYAWSASTDWQGKILATHYSYPWNQAGSSYNYDEVDFEILYDAWLGVTVAYSPNTSRYIAYRGFAANNAETIELNLQRPLLGQLSATAGAGYQHFSGGDVTGYAYGSIGAAYDLAPVVLAISFVDTTSAAKSLFYNAAAGGRWAGTVIWRF
jgi:uncharacterized protein (TIGR02001 family)